MAVAASWNVNDVFARRNDQGVLLENLAGDGRESFSKSPNEISLLAGCGVLNVVLVEKVAQLGHLESAGIKSCNNS